ncbi:MAG: Gfo/Idh/MocA family oxidoreductase [Actinomycetota bacterium]
MRCTIVGVGATGARVARQLAADSDIDELRLVDPDRDRSSSVARSIGDPAVAGATAYDPAIPADVVVLAGPPGRHRLQAELALGAGADVVSVADSVEDVRALLELDAVAARHDRRVIVGAGFSPGLSCLLARHAATTLDGVDEIHVAKTGTGGPACARQRHRALAGGAVDYREGAWVQRRGRTGRELCWFPDPVGAVDCYRASLPEVHLLVPAFPGVSRVTARISATRRDRLTALLPMMRPPHAEGGPGAVRVEIRGRRGSERNVVLLGAMDHPAVAAGAVAAVAVRFVRDGALGEPGARGLASIDDPLPMLRDLERRGVIAAVFEGS